MDYDKPFKTYEEQIKILKDRYKLTILNDDMAVRILQNIPYYDLINGYKDCFMENEVYKSGITIGDLYAFSISDKTLQSILFKYSTMVENAYKSRLAYIIAKNIGVNENTYLDSKHYYKSYDNKLFYNEFKNHCLDVYSGSKPIPQPTKHYYDNHNHIPPWILFKNVSFGNSINLIRFLKSNEQKELIEFMLPAKNIAYNNKVEYVIAALNLIREYRNKIAHNLKFISFKSTHNKLSPKATTAIFPNKLIGWKDINKNHIGVNDIYAYILALLLFINDSYLKIVMCNELSSFFRSHKKAIAFATFNSYYFSVTGLPENIDERLNRYVNMLK